MAETDDVPMDSRYMDYAEHERTYRFFTSLTKWGAIAVALVIMALAFFLV